MTLKATSSATPSGRIGKPTGCSQAEPVVSALPCAFTPGPWYATQADDRFPVRIREESTDAVLATGDDGGHPDPEFAIPDDIIMANARLMAAAPDLYAALKALIRLAHNSYDIEQECPEAFAALAKALGHD